MVAKAFIFNVLHNIVCSLFPNYGFSFHDLLVSHLFQHYHSYGPWFLAIFSTGRGGTIEIRRTVLKHGKQDRTCFLMVSGTSNFDSRKLELFKRLTQCSKFYFHLK